MRRCSSRSDPPRSCGSDLVSRAFEPHGSRHKVAPTGFAWHALLALLLALLGGCSSPLVKPGAQTVDGLALSTPLSLPSGTGIFAGWDRIVVHNTSRVYSIALPSGVVTDVGAVAAPPHTGCESWAYWGVAEYFSSQLYITYVRDWQTVERMAVM